MERYSYSKLNSWHTCPKGWAMTYLDHRHGEGNAFSSFGTLCHALLEGYEKGEYELSTLADLYEFSYPDAVQEPFPPNKCTDLAESYYRQGLEFFRTWEGYPDGTQILGVEQKFELPIDDDWILNGLIDLVYRDKRGRMHIRDHKSKKGFTKKELASYARQLYIYSTAVKEQYGTFPEVLEFFCFRSDKVYEIPFDSKAYEEAMDWARETVREIRNASVYDPNPDLFYCCHLCNHRKDCRYGDTGRWSRHQQRTA